MHTRIKRKIGLNSHFRHRNRPDSQVKSKGSKTFKTEESAHSWAKENKLSTSQYTLEKAKKDKKFKVVEKPSVKKE